MNSADNVAKGAILVFLAMVFGKLVSYLYVVLVSKLGSSVYGTLSIGFAVFMLIETFCIIGLDRGILRYVSYFKGKKDYAGIKSTIVGSLKISFVLSLFGFLFLFIFSEKIAIGIFANDDLSIILKLFSFFIPFSIIGHIFTISLRAFQKANYEILIKEFLQKSLKFLITLVLLLFGFKIIGAGLGFVIPIFITAVVSFFVLKKVFPIFGKCKTRISLEKELLVFSIPLMFVSLFYIIIAWTDILMIGYFKTASAVGIYNVALPTAGLIFVVPTALTYLFMPIIGELYGKDKLDEINSLYGRTSKWIFLMVFPIFLFMLFFSEKIITIFFGSNYAGASVPFLILIFGYMIFSLAYICSQTLSLIKKTKTIFIIILAFSLINIVLNYLLIPKFGLIGASIATSASFVVGAVLFFIFNYKFMSLAPFQLNFLKLGFCALLSILIIYLISGLLDFGLISLIILGLIYCLIYLGLLLLFKCLDNEDLAVFKEFKNKFFNRRI